MNQRKIINKLLKTKNKFDKIKKEIMMKQNGKIMTIEERERRLEEREQERQKILEQIKEAPLQNDYIFKRTFTKSGTKEILKDFLEGILERKVTNVKVNNSELPKDMLMEKGTVLDINAEIEVKDKRNAVSKHRNASK